MDINYCFDLLGSPCFPQSVWAAWVQAIGSVLAIGLSILFWRLDVRERRRRAFMAQAVLATYILLPVGETLQFLRSLKGPAGIVNVYGGYRGRHQHVASFKIPKRLQRARARTESLGDLGPLLLLFLGDLSHVLTIGQALMHGTRKEDLLAKHGMDYEQTIRRTIDRGELLLFRIEESIKRLS